MGEKSNKEKKSKKRKSDKFKKQAQETLEEHPKLKKLGLKAGMTEKEMIDYTSRHTLPELKKRILKKEVPETYKKKEKFPSIGNRIAQASSLQGKESHFQKIYGREGRKATLEEVEGESLKEIINDPEKRKWLKEHKEELIDEAAETAKELLKRGIIHSDINSGNIIIQKKKGKPKIKLIDFELSKLTSDERIKEREERQMTLDIGRDLNGFVSSITETLHGLNEPEYFRTISGEETPKELQGKREDILETQREVKEKIYEKFKEKTSKMHDKRKKEK